MDITSNPDDEIYQHLVTPRVQILSGRELAQTAVRRELIAAGASRSSGELSGLLALARALGVSVAEAQRLSGFARQTLYTSLKTASAGEFLDGDSERLARLLNIALVAAGQEQTLEQIGKALNILAPALLAPARMLVNEGLARLAKDGPPAAGAVLAPTELSSEWLRLHASSRELDDRAPGFTAYLRVEPGDVPRIDAVIGEIVGLQEAAVLPLRTAPSVMAGPELAITVRATDQRSALRAAEAIWDEIGKRAGLKASMRLADLHSPPTAPNARSAVLDGFLAGLGPGLGEEIANRARGERERYDGGEPERVLAARCLTLAARELRRELGRDDADRVPTISDGDSAFEELAPASGSGLASATANSAQIRKPLLAALKLAAERLGPFRGGELASFKAPGERPSVVREVAPSQEDLAEIARLSGATIAAGQGGEAHLVGAVRAVIDGGWGRG